MARHEIAHLEDLVTRVFMVSKTSESNAAAVARALVAAEADGLSSHGLSRVASYADQAVSGKVDGMADPVLSQTGSAAARVDAMSGFAYPAVDLALDWAQGFVPSAGIVGAAICRSHHAGAMGLHVERIAAHGFVAMAFTNSPAGLGPWGGNKALYGTNPIAFACPRSSEPPLVIDLSLAKVARGKIKMAADRGEDIPEGWAVDVDGRPTTDSAAAMSGMLLPMGEAKGAALALMVEIMAATLTGSHHGFEASSFFSADGPPPHIGQFFLVIDPEAFSGGAFSERMETLVLAILDQQGTRLPGQRRQQVRAEAARDGIEVPDALYDDLVGRAAG